MKDNTVFAATQAEEAYHRARRKAFLRHVWSTLPGHRSNKLLSYDAVRKSIIAGAPIYRGMQSVEVDRIVGSVDRYRDFDRAFLPTQSFTGSRWKRVGRAYYDDIILPPVKLYKVGDVYFVIDGNHRISVARETGRAFVDAEVIEHPTRVKVSSDIDNDDLPALQQKSLFLEETGLDVTRPDVDITLTMPEGYTILAGHIEYHRYLQSIEWKREFTTQEAAVQWVDQVYLPVIDVIRQNNVLAEFPGHTEGDLYLWIIEHRHYLREQFGDRVSTWDAARSFTRYFRTRFFGRLWASLKRRLGLTG